MAREISRSDQISRLMRVRSLGSSRVAVGNAEFSLRDECTHVSTSHRAWRAPGPFDPQVHWMAAWDELRKALRMHEQRGVLLAAIDSSGALCSHAWAARSADKVRSLIAGRHSRCDLLLPSDDQDLSLRHLALVVLDAEAGTPSVTVMDLRSGSGFVDESGRTLHALRTEGPMFLKVQDLVVAVLLTAPDADWPEDAEKAYALLPPRVFLDEQHLLLPFPGVRLACAARPENTTSVSKLAGVRSLELPMLAEGEAAQLVLDLEEEGGTRGQLVLGRTALEQGVLLGRYERCDRSHFFQSSETISRVHALLIDLGDGPMLVDTASTNGVTVGGEDLREVRLTAGLKVRLEKEVELVVRELTDASPQRGAGG